MPDTERAAAAIEAMVTSQRMTSEEVLASAAANLNYAVSLLTAAASRADDVTEKLLDRMDGHEERIRALEVNQKIHGQILIDGHEGDDGERSPGVVDRVEEIEESRAEYIPRFERLELEVKEQKSLMNRVYWLLIGLCAAAVSWAGVHIFGRAQ